MKETGKTIDLTDLEPGILLLQNLIFLHRLIIHAIERMKLMNSTLESGLRELGSDVESISSMSQTATQLRDKCTRENL